MVQYRFHLVYVQHWFFNRINCVVPYPSICDYVEQVVVEIKNRSVRCHLLNKFECGRWLSLAGLEATQKLCTVC